MASIIKVDTVQNAAGTSNAELLGTTTNGNATAGYVGEIQTATRLRSAATAIVTATTINVTASPIVLTAGHWSVRAYAGFTTSTASWSQMIVSVSATSATTSGADTIAVPTGGEVRFNDETSFTLQSVDRNYALAGYSTKVANAATLTLYLVARAIISAGTMTVYGSVEAIRIR